MVHQLTKQLKRRRYGYLCHIDPVTMIQTLSLLSFRTLEDLGLSDVWITMAGPIYALLLPIQANLFK
jgi:hypothetical protein